VGIASIVYWGTGVPVQDTYFVVMRAAHRRPEGLGWRFCAKTIYAVIVFTLGTSLMQHLMPPDLHLLADQKFMACIVGGVFMGASVGLGLSTGGSTGGSDVVAAIVNKYRDVSLGHIIMLVDVMIITSSYVVLKDWEKVSQQLCALFVMAFCVIISSTPCARVCSFSSSPTSTKRLGVPST
jgi:uncharacterized membrane-anchored protein YitT (DUF2179 family)